MLTVWAARAKPKAVKPARKMGSCHLPILIRFKGWSSFAVACIIDSFSGKNQSRVHGYSMPVPIQQYIRNRKISPDLNASVRSRMLVQGVASGWM
jgi:hypothetical protein